MTRLIIARHGNTFGPEDIPTRVGARTDLPLVDGGIKQAVNLGKYLRENNLHPDTTYSSHLKRTKQTAKMAIKQFMFGQPVFALDIFNEVDYGPDENKVEADVIARIGAQAIKDWDESAIVPDGWLVDPDQIVSDWQNFAQHMADDHAGETILVVTSNGTARFAPHITGDYEGFCADHPIKLKTGAFGIFEHSPEDGWRCAVWGVRP